MSNKPDWLNERSAAIPIIFENNQIKVVLITTKPKEKNNWIFPKGQVELGMPAHESAAKEAFEEAGVVGHTSPTLFDKYEHTKWGGKMSIKVYILEVSKVYDVWLEMHARNRKIVDLEQAIQLVQANQKQTLKKLQKKFKTNSFG